MQTIARRIALPAVILAALPVLAADALAVKPGLWETTVITAASGMPTDALANIPPAQRAQIEAMMQQRGTAGPRTHKSKSCVTEKDLREGAFRQDRGEAAQRCKYTPVVSTGRRQEFALQCAGPGGAPGGTGRFVVEAPDNAHVRGEFQMRSSGMNIDAKFTSQWLASSCAGADKDSED
jgi:hypothetical protein